MKKVIRSVALLLCLLTCLLTVFGCQKKNGDDDNNQNTEAFDYLTTDLDAYIDIPASLYQNLHVSVNLDAVTDAEVNDAIGNVLYDHRSEVGVGKTTGTVGYGDIVSLWYRGYLKDEETGKETDLYGSSNFANAEPTDVSVGAGGYVTGFESALVGATYNAVNNKGLSKRPTGSQIQDGDTVYVLWSGTKQLEDNSYQGVSNQMVRFVYDEENRDEVESQYGLPAAYQEGTMSFFDLVKTVNVGEYFDGDATFLVNTETAGETRSVWYYSIMIYAATSNECEENKLATAKTYFPINYGSETFNGKTVYFDFYIDSFYNSFKDYETPALDETFIFDTLGLSEDDLSAYAGEDAVSRYKNKIKAALEEAQDMQTAIFNGLWEIWNDGVSVKGYPAGEVEAFVAEYRNDLDAAIADAAENAGMTVTEYTTYYYSEEEFAKQYYDGMESTDTVESYMQKKATDAAKEKLILYALAKKTNNVPTDAERDEYYNALVDNYLEYYLSDTSDENEYRRDNFDTEEAFLEAKAELRTKIVDYYGESFLRESAFYQYVMEALAENVVETSYLGRTAVA